MWPLGSFRSSRSSEVRRRLADGSPVIRTRLRSLLGWPLLVVALFWGAAALIVLSADQRLAYYAGTRLTQPVLSRVSFERVNAVRTQEQKRKAQQEVPNFFRLNTGLVDAIQAEFRDFHAAVKEAESFERYRELYGDRWPLEEVAFEAFKPLTDESGSEQFRRKVDGLAARIARENMIERAEVETDREVRSTAGEVMLDRGGGEFSAVPKERLTYASNPDHVRRLAEDVGQSVVPTPLKEAAARMVERVIAPGAGQFRPVYVFDRETTRSRIEQRVAGLEPVKDRYEPGDLLVQAGTLDEQGVALLKAEHEEYLRQRSIDPDLRSQWRKKRVGLMGLLLMITAGLATYTVYAQPRIMQKPSRAAAFAGVVLLMLLADRVLFSGIGVSPMWSVATIATTSAIFTIAYSRRFALGAGICLALFTVVTLDAPLNILFIYLSVASIVVVLLREIRTRLKMVIVGFLTAGAAFVSAVCVGLTDQQATPFILAQASYAALAALAGISVVLVVLPLIEKAFGITTSLTLLEWADTSNPLLRQLIEKAPGTWQHSHLLGSMAEAAAEEIGANGLLARVGAYYHDIGKICKSNYFVENQQARMSAHRGLSPTMSLLVILAHVKDGLALAREHRLPPPLLPFIAEHHGTTVVRYFHALAEREARSRGMPKAEVSDTEFRYPGPKPSTKESAILMLCDGVEGAVRALAEPTPGRIETVVHEVVMERLMDGQLDNTDLTLKELFRIEQSLVRSLRAIHHGRIAYPERERKSDSAIISQVRTA